VLLLLLRQPHLRLARMKGATMLQHTQQLLQHTQLRLARMTGATMLQHTQQLLQHTQLRLARMKGATMLGLPVLQLLQLLVPHALRSWCMRP
jgi:hypothetical protein